MEGLPGALRHHTHARRLWGQGPAPQITHTMVA